MTSRSNIVLLYRRTTNLPMSSLVPLCSGQHFTSNLRKWQFMCALCTQYLQLFVRKLQRDNKVRKPRVTFQLIHVPYIYKNREALIVLFICLCADTLGVLARTIGSDNFISLADECIQLGLVGSKPNNLTVKRQYDAPPTCMSGGRRTAG